MDAVLHSSDRTDWCTPPAVLELVRQVHRIVLDPCTNAHNPVGALVFYTEEDDGLACPWGTGPAFVNHGYGKACSPWTNKIIKEAESGCEITQLCPARPDTQWYKRAHNAANASCEWEGRIKFVGAPHPAPFPSALFYHGPSPYLFCHVFQGHGRVRVMRTTEQLPIGVG